MEKQRESKKTLASEEGGKLGPWGGGTSGAGGAAEGGRRVLEGLSNVFRVTEP